MTLAYSADALCFDADTDSYALRPDYDPGRHRVDIETGGAFGWAADKDSGWNAPDDPPIAQVRDMFGVPIHAGHAYVADRFRLTCPNGTVIQVDTMEIDHDPVGLIVDDRLEPGVSYPLAQIGLPYRIPDDPPLAAGFGPGTMISTRDGDLPVEWLAPGDEVLTFDNGPQTLHWVGYSRLSTRQLAQNSGLHPVQLVPGMASFDALTHDLRLAPDTHVLIGGAKVSLNFGVDQSLARVGDLADQMTPGRHVPGLTYFLLLFDQHQVVCANGLWCESLFANARDWGAVAQRFPTAPRHIRHNRYAQPCLNRWETQLLRDMHPQVQLMRRADAA